MYFTHIKVNLSKILYYAEKFGRSLKMIARSLYLKMCRYLLVFTKCIDNKPHVKLLIEIRNKCEKSLATFYMPKYISIYGKFNNST